MGRGTLSVFVVSLVDHCAYSALWWVQLMPSIEELSECAINNEAIPEFDPAYNEDKCARTLELPLLVRRRVYCLYSDTVPGLVREHQADKAMDDIRNSARTSGHVLKTRSIPRTLSALLLVE